jgi:GNAT superfamily N-acetyltransferase
VNIVELDPDSERDLADAAAVETAYWREVLGEDEPATTVAEILRRLRLKRDDVDGRFLLAREGDETVGMSYIEIRRGFGNEHMAWLEDLYVLAPRRRRGVGRALLEANIDIARAADRSLLIGGYDDGNVDGEAFVAALGMRIANRERQNRVRVDALDRALLESWDRAPDGYSLVQFDGRCPDDLIDHYVRIQAVMNDAPRSESLGDFNLTVAHRRAAESEWLDDGTEYWFAGARHDATGDMAGYTEMIYRPDKPWVVEQEDTAVHPDHRGRSIGKWLKAVNALRVLDERPAATVIETWNDGTNRWMLDINTAMGFRPVVTWVEAELDL